MHELLSDLAQTVGLVLFVLAFLLVLTYALAPSNRKTFEQASRVPLEDEDTSDER